MKLWKTFKRLYSQVKQEAQVIKSLKYLKEQEITALTLRTLLDESVNKNVQIVVEQKNGRLVIVPLANNNKVTTFKNVFDENHPF